MIFNRIWAMPNKWTFSIKPIANLIDKYHKQGYMENCVEWVDPFAGKLSPAGCKNDLNPELGHSSCEDALLFLKKLNTESFGGAFYDPPYSMRQASECYKSFGKGQQTATVTSMQYWSSIKNELARIIKPGGFCMCLGWNSMGLGKARGFHLLEILLVCHGGSRNDTIVTVEEKIIEGN